MSCAKVVYDLIAKRQAHSVDALAIATGQPARRVRTAVDHLLREGLIERGESFRPAIYSATPGSEPPRPVGRPFLERQDADSIVAQAMSSRHALYGVWGREVAA